MLLLVVQFGYSMVMLGFVDPVNQALFNFHSFPKKKKTRFPGKRSRELCAGAVDKLKAALLDRGSLWIVGFWMC